MTLPTRFDRDYHARRLSKENEKYRAQARRRGVAEGPVDALAVLDRDNWICAVCEDEIDPTSRWVGSAPGASQADENRWLPSLDHVIVNGPHTMENVRAAHALCSSWRDVHSIETIRRERSAAAEVERFLERRPAASTYRAAEVE